MLHDFRILCFAMMVSAAVISIVFSFPALTTRDGIGASETTQADFEAVFSQEYSFCEGQPEEINCQCFASVSRTILADNGPRVRGARYANKQDLARGQAADSC